MNDLEILKKLVKDINAIENLINRVKELEDTLKCTQDSWYEDTKKIEELKNKVKDLEEIEEEHRKENGKLQKKIKELDNDVIPKSKVREKIEKWESICRAEQLESLNDNHAEYWSCFEDVLEKIKEQLLQDKE